MSLLYDKTKTPKQEDLITDWYLPQAKPLDGFVYPGALNVSVNERLYKIATDLVKICDQQTGEEFSINYDDKVYRGHSIESVAGKFYALRRIPNYIPPLEDLGLSVPLQNILTHEELKKGGIILIVGETGQGKSTTCSSTIKSRLEKYGSFCLTVEDPPEHPLHGLHGEGRCIQTPVKSGEFAEALKGAVRCYPTIGNCILYVGETRDPETAHEALVAATNGHLVFTTLHASDVIAAIKRISALAGLYKNTSEADVKSMLASTMRLVVHQRLKQGNDLRRMETSFLFCPNGSNGIAQKIRNNQVDMLSTDIETQANQLKNNNFKFFGNWNYNTK